MGKKTKTGKARKDKYYQLAKESGYRSRAAFKLLQINRKFEFLQSASVLIDLCAAPGSWLQVAKEVMPPQHTIIGVDLVSIAHIPTVDTLQADITTQACRQALRDRLAHIKADVVLHDGAPNVGTSWSLDEFQQAHLCLQAFHLATEFLVKGGTFVTKVFRSRDYEPLKWVLDQFFVSVKVTKPEASRLESAEIYLVCQRYRAPDNIDPKFFDQRHVFKEVDCGANASSGEAYNNSLINLWHPEKKRRQRDGYADGDTLYFELKASEFIASQDFLPLLARANKIVIDQDYIAQHALTTEELKHDIQDIKVLGKAELKKVLKWRKALTQNSAGDEEKAEKKDLNGLVPLTKTSEQVAEDELVRLQEEEAKAKKKKLKKQQAQHKKLQTRIQLQMTHPGDMIEQVDDELFSLKNLSAAQLTQLEELTDVDVDSMNPIRQSIHDKALNEARRLAAASQMEGLCVSGPEVRFDKAQAGETTHKWERQKLTTVDPELDVDTAGPSAAQDSDDEKEPATKRHRPLTVLERALAVKLIQSQKARRQLTESTYNRYNFSYDTAEKAPAFLVEDERKHARSRPPVTKTEIDAQRHKEVNVRTCKKVEQAKARKRRRMLKRQKRVTEKLEGLPEDLTDKERVMKIREVYKKAGLRTKRKPTNIVVNNRGGSKQVKASTKGGRTKVVDRRMKADERSSKKGKSRSRK